MKRSMTTLNPKSADNDMKEFIIELVRNTRIGAEPQDYNDTQT